MTNTWNELESTLIKIYSLPHNRIELKNKTPVLAVKEKIAEVKSGLGVNVRREEFISKFISQFKKQPPLDGWGRTNLHSR